MSERTGLGPLEQAIVLTIGARRDRSLRKSALVLAEIERRAGFGPRYTYEALCDLARPWAVMLPLIEGHGNFGSPDFPAAEARYTECRLSPAGMLAVAAERGDIPALPFGIINGTHYRGGTQPSFEPTRLLTALLRLVEDPTVSDNELLQLVGPPAFPTRCQVSGEVDRLVIGQRATLRLSAVITAGEEPGGVVLDMSHLPPGASATQVGYWVASRVNRHLADDDELGAKTNVALRDVENLSAGDETMIRCRAAEGADPDVVKERLRDIWGVTIEVTAELPASLPELLRSWLRQQGVGDGTAAALTQLAKCL